MKYSKGYLLLLVIIYLGFSKGYHLQSKSLTSCNKLHDHSCKITSITVDKSKDRYNWVSFAGNSSHILLAGSLACLQGYSSAKCIMACKSILARLSSIHNRFTFGNVPFIIMGVLFTLQYAIFQPDLTLGPSTIVNDEPKTFSLRRQVNRLASVTTTVGAFKSPMGYTGPVSELSMTIARLIVDISKKLGQAALRLFPNNIFSNYLVKTLNNWQVYSKEFIIAGAAAGMASNFNTGLSGAIFSLEVFRRLIPSAAPLKLSIDSLAIVAFAALSGLTAARTVGNGNIFPKLSFLALNAKSYEDTLKMLPLLQGTPIFALIGVLAGSLCTLLVKLQNFLYSIVTPEKKTEGSRRLTLPWQIKPFIGSLALIVISCFGVHVNSLSNSGFVQTLVQGNDAFKSLTSVTNAASGASGAILALNTLILRFLMVAICQSTGIIGGLVAPSLFMGSAAGYLVQYIFTSIHTFSMHGARTHVPGVYQVLFKSALSPLSMSVLYFRSSPALCAGVGASAMLGAMFKAPLMASAFLAELSCQPLIFIPCLLASSLACITIDKLSPVSTICSSPLTSPTDSKIRFSLPPFHTLQGILYGFRGVIPSKPCPCAST